MKNQDFNKTNNENIIVEKIKKINFFHIALIFFSYILIELHINNPTFGDDFIFKSAALKMNIFDFVKMRYMSWSSRTIIEFCVVLISTHKVFWKICNISIIFLFTYSIYKLFVLEYENKFKTGIFLLFSILMIPAYTISSTGWIATTLNYLWVLSLGVYACLLIKDNINKNHIKWYKYLSYILATIYAANHEQMALVLFFIFAYYIFYLIKNKNKIDWKILLIFAIIILELIYILTCPGNYIRKKMEVIKWLSSFDEYTILGKMYLSSVLICKYTIISFNFSYFLMNVLMCLYIFKKCNNTKKSVFALINLIFSTIILITIHLPLLYTKYMRLVYAQPYQFLTLDSLEINSFSVKVVSMTIYTFFQLLTIINFIIIYKQDKKFKIPILLYYLGFLSANLLGFSPTVFASVDRVLIFYYTGILIINIFVFRELIKEFKILNNFNINITEEKK